MNRTRTTLALVVAFAMTAAPIAYAIDGVDLPTKYAGYLAATQANATGFGNGFTGSLSGPNEYTIGSELDRLYVTSDLSNLWIGVTGNLPNKLADGQSIVILMQVNDPDPVPSDPNVLITNGLPGFGGGYNALRALDQLTLPGGGVSTGFYPDWAIVVNRALSTPPDSLTYGNAWFMPTNLEMPYDANITSADPANTYAVGGPNAGQPLYMSVFMNTTNSAGVTATTQPTPDGTGPGTQEALAPSAVKGLRVRLSMNDALTGAFGIGAFQTIRLAIVLMTPDGTVSNQTLPPITVPNAPAFPNCFPTTQPISHGAGTFDPEYFRTQDATYKFFSTVTLSNLGQPGATGKDGTDIPNATTGFPTGSLVATQRLHTCFGDATPNPVPPLTYTVPGSELDQLFVKRDADAANGFLNIGVSGNLERNGNKLYLFVDTGNPASFNVLSNVGNMGAGLNSLRTWQGRKFDAGFNPRYVYMINNTSGTLFVNAYDLSIPFVDGVSDPNRYLGSVPIGAGTGVLSGGTNTNNDEFAFDNSNTLGVDGGNPGAPGNPASATTGLEAKIKLSEIGATASTCTIRVAAMLSGTDGGGRSFLSNQSLPSYAPMSANVGAETVGGPSPATQPFDFGNDVDGPNTDPYDGRPAFAGAQYTSSTAIRPGDVKDDGNCCVNAADVPEMVRVLLGLNTNPRDVQAADLNADGIVNGKDIQPFVNLLFSQSPCP